MTGDKAPSYLLIYLLSSSVAAAVVVAVAAVPAGICHLVAAGCLVLVVSLCVLLFFCFVLCVCVLIFYCSFCLSSHTLRCLDCFCCFCRGDVELHVLGRRLTYYGQTVTNAEVLLYVHRNRKAH